MIHPRGGTEGELMSEVNGGETATETRKATFGAGCFWQVEETFRALDGVIDTAVGYEGGELENPTYEQVCTGKTGHVEVVQVEFDPDRVAYSDLVQKYFEIHDPTQLNRQGPDVGWQYRSVIFAEDEAQAEAARAVLDANRGRFRDEIVTEIEPAKPFWRAEEYHQCYLQKRHSSGGLLGQLLGR
jgi:peptide-methionine (S)-S-oxide reductase